MFIKRLLNGELPSVCFPVSIVRSFVLFFFLLPFSGEVWCQSRASYVYRGGVKDGFGISVSFSVEMTGGGSVCEGGEASFAVRIDGVNGRYRVHWYRVGKAESLFSSAPDGVSDGYSAVYRFRAFPDDAGEYYCMVRDCLSGEELSSDTLSLSVRSSVRGSILSPSSGDTTLCPGSSVVLRGSSSAEGVTGEWYIAGGTGEERLQGDEAEVSVDGDVTYVYHIPGSDCFIDDSVHLGVYPLSLLVESDIRSVEGRSVSLVARDSSGVVLPGSSVSWSFNGQEAGSGNPLVVRAGSSGVYQVRYRSGECDLFSSVNLSVRRAVFCSGGVDDGYGRSLCLKADLQLLQGIVCERDSVVLVCGVESVNRHYSRRWYEVRGTDTLFISDCSSDTLVFPAGSSCGYFCRVTDGVSGDSVTSGVVSLQVKPRPYVTVPSDTLLCPGSGVLLSGHCAMEDAFCGWYVRGGEQVSPGKEVFVSPAESEVYVFRADNQGCREEDSVHVYRDGSLSVSLGGERHVSSGSRVVFRAVNGAGHTVSADSLSWSFRGSSLASSNPLSFDSGSESGYVRVVYGAGHCELSDSVWLHVRGGGPDGAGQLYRGGIGDGYSRSVSFKVWVSVTGEEVAEHSGVLFRASVEGLEGLYQCRWYRRSFSAAEGDREVFRDSVVVGYPRVEVGDAGVYYCMVTDPETGYSVRSNDVRLRVKRMYTSGVDVEDGYAVSCVSPLVYREWVSASPVCHNDEEVELGVHASAPDVHYMWQRRDDDAGTYRDVAGFPATSLPALEEAARVSGVRDRRLVFHRAEQSDGGFYRCALFNRCVRARKGKDGVEVEYVYSDTVYSAPVLLEVKEQPVAVIVSPERDSVVVCRGSDMLLSGVSSVAGADNYWEGYRFDGDEIRVRPEGGRYYVFVSSYGGCTGKDSVYAVPDSSFLLLEDPYVSTSYGRRVSLKASFSGGEADSVYWYREPGHILYPSSSSVARSSSCVVFSEIADTTHWLVGELHTGGGCVVKDSALVRVRSVAAYRGGEQDGFVQTSTHFEVEVTAPYEVCEGGTFNLTASVVYGREDINYIYQWYHITEDNDTLECPTTRAVYTLDGVTPSDGGLYFCEVSDGYSDRPVRSNDIVMEVVPAIVPVIEVPFGRDTTLCLGDTLELRGDIQSSGVKRVRLRWEGAGLLTDPANREVLVSPAEDTEYRLVVENKGCNASSSVMVYVKRPDLYIGLPQVVTCVQGQEAEIEASDRRGGKLWKNRLEWLDVNGDKVTEERVNPLFFRPDSAMAVCCRYTNDGCSAVACVEVKMRDGRVFGGGEDDGFSEGCRFYYPHLPACDTLRSGDSLLVDVPVYDRGMRYEWTVLYREGGEERYASSREGLYLPRVSTAEDSSLIFCDILRGECTERSDTLLLRVVNELRLEVGEDSLLYCAEDSVGVVVRLTGGDLPWSYRCVLPSGEERERRDIVSAEDTLYAGAEGLYRFAVLSEGGVLLSSGDSVWLEEVPLSRYHFSGGDTVCPGGSDTLHLQVEGGVGNEWWQVRVAEVGEGDSVIHTLRLFSGRDTSWIVGGIEGPRRYVVESARDETAGCRAWGEDTVHVYTEKEMYVGFTLVGDARVGMCRETDVYGEWLPLGYEKDKAAVVLGKEDGYFVIGDVSLGKDGIWDVASARSGWHDVRYVYGGGVCSRSDAVRLYADSLPEADVMCVADICVGTGGSEGETEIRSVSSADGMVYFRRTVVSRRKGLSEGGDVNRYTLYDSVRLGNYRYAEKMNRGAEDSCVIYSLDSIRDIHGCVGRPGVSDTMWVHGPRELSLRGRSVHKGGAFRAESVYLLCTGDTLEVEAELKGGEGIWDLMWEEDTLRGIAGRNAMLQLPRAGVWHFRAGDGSCGEAEDSVEVMLLDTGYLRVRLLLEEYYSEEGDSMRQEGSVVLEVRRGSSAAEAAAGGEESVVSRDSFRVLCDGRVVVCGGGDSGREELGFAGVYAGEGYRYGPGDSLYVVALHDDHLGICSSRGIRFSGDRSGAVTLDLRMGESVYSSDDLDRHMSRRGERWLMSAGEVNGNALLTVRDMLLLYGPSSGETARPSDVQRYRLSHRNRSRYSEVK